MGCRGVHFALSTEDEQDLLAIKDDRDRLVFITDNIEERYFGGEYACESDKAWDAIHRCFDEGALSYSTATPERMAILGGWALYSEDDYIISHKDAGQVAEIASALAAVDEAGMRQRYFAIDEDDYGLPVDEQDFAYTWEWFVTVRAFYQRAAADGRAVIFTVDQ